MALVSGGWALGRKEGENSEDCTVPRCAAQVISIVSFNFYAITSKTFPFCCLKAASKQERGRDLISF
jgi:hypothetical protein